MQRVRVLSTGVGFPRILLLVLALLQAGGIFDLVRRTTCEQECKRNGCDDCTPDGDSPMCSCHCPSGVTAVPKAVVVATVAPPTPVSKLTFDTVERLCPSPDPREILHVPRLRVG